MTPQYQSDMSGVQAPQQFYQATTPQPQAQMSPAPMSPTQGLTPHMVHMMHTQMAQTGQTPQTIQASQIAQAAQMVQTAQSQTFQPTLTPQTHQTLQNSMGLNFTSPYVNNQPLGPAQSTPRSYASEGVMPLQWQPQATRETPGYQQRVPGQPPRPNPYLVNLQQQGNQGGLRMLGFTSQDRSQQSRLPSTAEQRDTERRKDHQVRKNLENINADLRGNYRIPSLEPPAGRPNTPTLTQVPIPGTESQSSRARRHRTAEASGSYLDQISVAQTITRLECLMPNGIFRTLSSQPAEECLRVDGQQSPHPIPLFQRVDFRVRASSQANIDRSLASPTTFPAKRIGDGIDPPPWLNKAVGGTLSRQHADRLVTQCFEKAMPASRFFYKAPVLQTLDELYSGGDIRVLEVDVWRHNRLSVLYMVLAIGELAEPIRPDCR